MTMSAEGLVSSIQQNSRFSAVENASVRFPSAASGEGIASSGGKDSVDLVGLRSVEQAFKMLKEKDSTPLPDAVGHAIQALAKEALAGLPGGGNAFALSGK